MWGGLVSVFTIHNDVTSHIHILSSISIWVVLVLMLVLAPPQHQHLLVVLLELLEFAIAVVWLSL